MSVTEDERIIAEFNAALNNLLRIRIETRKEVLSRTVMTLLEKGFITIEHRIV